MEAKGGDEVGGGDGTEKSLSPEARALTDGMELVPSQEGPRAFAL